MWMDEQNNLKNDTEINFSFLPFPFAIEVHVETFTAREVTSGKLRNKVLPQLEKRKD